jgi:hypothetical protein
LSEVESDSQSVFSAGILKSYKDIIKPTDNEVSKVLFMTMIILRIKDLDFVWNGVLSDHDTKLDKRGNDCNFQGYTKGI